MRRVIWLSATLLLTACGGGSRPSSPVPPNAPPPAIADVTVYLTQSRCPDGSPPTACSNAAPQLSSDQMMWRRWDGQDQVEDTVAVPSRGFYETTWSYAPFGIFIAAHGDGGEVYVRNGGNVSIVATQDGGTPGIQRFLVWGLFNDQTVSCDQGWTAVDLFDRACRATVTYPASGYGLTSITADTVVSEHYSGLGYTGEMERFYMAAGWGRLCWSAHNTAAPRGGMAPSCGTGDPAPSMPASDRRLITSLVPNAGLIQTLDDYGWPPAGFAP